MEGIEKSADHDGGYHEGEETAQGIGHQHDAIGRLPVAERISLYAAVMNLHQERVQKTQAIKPANNADGALQAIGLGEYQRKNRACQGRNQCAEQGNSSVP